MEGFLPSFHGLIIIIVKGLDIIQTGLQVENHQLQAGNIQPVLNGAGQVLIMARLQDVAGKVQ